MKTILLIITFAGLATASAYAQNRNCPCKKNVQHNLYDNSSAKGPEGHWLESGIYSFRDNDELNDVKITGPIAATCFQYRQHNIVVTECPGIFYDNSDLNANVRYETEQSYMGYYPETNPAKTIGPIAPQHSTSDKNDIAPEGGNTYTNPRLK